MKINFFSISSRSTALLMAVLALSITVTTMINNYYYLDAESSRIKKEIPSVAAGLGSQLNLKMAYNAADPAQVVINTLSTTPYYFMGCTYRQINGEPQGLFVSYYSGDYPDLKCPTVVNEEFLRVSDDGNFIEFSTRAYEQFTLNDEGSVIEVPNPDELASFGFVYIVASIDKAKSVNNIGTDVPVFAAVTILIPVFLLFVYLQRSITSPISQLKLAVQEFEKTGKANLIPHRFNNDEVGSLVKSFKKMTETISNQQKTILNHNIDLNDKVNSRTRELKKAVDNLKSFTHSVSHDLSSPLRHVDAYIQIVLEEDTDLNDNTVENLESAASIVNKMFDLIDSFMVLSEVSEVPLKKEILSLTSIAQKVIESQKATKPSNIEYVVHDDVKALGDRGLLEIVLTNLIDNACKYRVMDRQTKIEFGKRFEKGELVYFVKDNGIGFDQEMASSAFKLFTRLTSDKSKGYGVGLHTVKRVVERHGGRVWVNSSPNKGSTFCFTLDPGRKYQLLTP